jgi:hypothetical protein
LFGDAPSHFVEDWVRIGFLAKKKVLSQHPTVPFDDQCSILEKVRTGYDLVAMAIFGYPLPIRA